MRSLIIITLLFVDLAMTQFGGFPFVSQRFGPQQQPQQQYSTNIFPQQSFLQPNIGAQFQNFVDGAYQQFQQYQPNLNQFNNFQRPQNQFGQRPTNQQQQQNFNQQRPQNQQQNFNQQQQQQRPQNQNQNQRPPNQQDPIQQQRPQQPQQQQQQQQQQVPVQQTTLGPSALEVNRFGDRISQKKCAEYAKLIQKKYQVASLTTSGSNHDIEVNTCTPSQGLIIGGTKTKPGEFPHVAAIGWRNLNEELEFKCGGSLISERHVLTAAHCAFADRNKPSVVRLGEQNLVVRDVGSPEVDYEIAEFINHENYDRDTKHNDIALIRLATDVKFTKFIRPACLYPSDTITKKSAIASGWGYTEVAGPTSDELLKVELDIIPNDRCSAIFNDESNYNIDNTQLCAGVLQGGKDTCNGDSGGPLQIVNSNNQCVFYLIGITSYGTPYCGMKNSPGIYSKVSAYIDWIEQKVW